MVSGFTPVVLLFFPMIPVNSHQQGAVVIGGAQHFDREIITVGKNQVQFRALYSVLETWQVPPPYPSLDVPAVSTPACLYPLPGR